VTGRRPNPLDPYPEPGPAGDPGGEKVYSPELNAGAEISPAELDAMT
jgi:hypothetical protein